MIKLDSLSRWSRLDPGSAMVLAGGKERKIRVNVNSPGCRLYVGDGKSTPEFLTVVPPGRDVVEFAAPGNVYISTDVDDVFLYSSENEPTFTIIENAAIFTEVIQRAARNPDLEYMMYQQRLNMERLYASMDQEINQRVRNAVDAAKPAIRKSDAPGNVAEEELRGKQKQDRGSKSATRPESEDRPADAGNGTSDNNKQRHAVDDGPALRPEPKV